jgi:hypothetical protein
MGLKAGSLAAAGGGALLVWSGIRGRSWSTVLRDIIGGHSPAIATTAYRIEPGTPDDGSGSLPVTIGTGPPSALAGTITGLKSHFQYEYGAAPATGLVDCSSLINEGCRLLGLAVPFDRHYTGKTHGPNTVAWIAWTGCTTVPYREAQSGDLAIWQTHMGVITGPNQMFSALNPAKDLRYTPIKGDGAPIRNEVLFVRRLKGIRMAGR